MAHSIELLFDPDTEGVLRQMWDDLAALKRAGLPIRIPPGTVWVMSDYRAGALIDSRVYGAVPEQALMGRVVAVLTPLSRIGIL